MILSRWQRFGYACVNFGPSISMRHYARQNRLEFSRMSREVRFQEIEKFAEELMDSIGNVIPILPVALVASVLKATGDEGLSAFEVESRVNELIENLNRRDAPVYISSRSRVQTILNALNMLKLRKLVVETGGIYRPASGEMDVLTYYANSIAHWEHSET
jgi:glycerol-3-phosphate O-acyltransferase